MTSTIPSERPYYVVAAVLMALLALTVAAALVDLGPFNTPIALAIATAKALLVVWYFMHIRFGGAVLRLFVAAGFVFLLILLAFSMADYMTRVVD